MVKMLSKAKKLYLDNYSLDKLKSNFEGLDPFFKSFKNDILLLSPQGVISIRTAKVCAMKPVDKPIQQKENYFNGYNLLIDESYYEEERVFSQIPYTHTFANMTTFYYYTNDLAKVHLAVEGIYQRGGIQSTDTSADLRNKYRNFTPVNFYFLTNCKEESEWTEDLNELLRLL
jgi:hypothetical protein